METRPDILTVTTKYWLQTDGRMFDNEYYARRSYTEQYDYRLVHAGDFMELAGREPTTSYGPVK